MALDAELKAILACPVCRGALLFPDAREEIHCPACQRAYPLLDGIPVLLAEESRPLSAAPSR